MKRSIVGVACGICLVSLASSSAAQFSGGTVHVNLFPEDAAAAALAISQGRALPPEQVAGAPAAFWGVAPFPVRVAGFDDRGLTWRGNPTYLFDVTGPDAPEQYRAAYSARAVDGSIVQISFDSVNEDATPDLNVDAPTALATAQSFLQQKYPPFSQGQWVLHHERHWDEGQNWNFQWWPVVDPVHGTRGIDYAGVSIQRHSGKIVSVVFPDLRVNGPTAPQVTQQQAELLAAQVCPFDPFQYPFIEVYLEMAQDEFGIQGPQWVFIQDGPTYSGYTEPERAWSYVDALTGEAFTTTTFDGPFHRKPKVTRRPKLPRGFPWPRAPARPVALRAKGGKALAPLLPPEVRGGRVWVRGEALQAFGAKVSWRENGLRLHAGALGNLRAVDASECGGKARENGWWVPLRVACGKLGWRVSWDPKRREAVVDTGTGPSSGPGAVKAR